MADRALVTPVATRREATRGSRSSGSGSSAGLAGRLDAASTRSPRPRAGRPSCATSVATGSCRSRCLGQERRERAHVVLPRLRAVDRRLRLAVRRRGSPSAARGRRSGPGRARFCVDVQPDEPHALVRSSAIAREVRLDRVARLAPRRPEVDDRPAPVTRAPRRRRSRP